ncbi:RNA polymerase sigma factor [Gabonibacter chumensis]|uniref:RNA polymerase sigma factor n=1 Tax=Gabonibacter chumensis TaxID=2972474 RepID=UPI002572482F|nr:RNA polymerase sigma factor [Gabonibacter chumensis]MCR9012177.1 RNA polymerase sigma factor [Gabonibacter chumensis]
MTRVEYNRSVDDISDGLFRFLYKACRSKEMAQDIVQDSFLKLWEMLSVIEKSKAKSFLYTTAYHRMIDLLRREYKYGDIEEIDSRFSEESNNPPDLQDVLDSALAKLPTIQKTVVLLRDYESYSYQEIAEITGLNETQVKVYIFRARAYMKEFIRRPDLVI